MKNLTKYSNKIYRLNTSIYGLYLSLIPTPNNTEYIFVGGNPISVHLNKGTIVYCIDVIEIVRKDTDTREYCAVQLLTKTGCGYCLFETARLNDYLQPLTD